MLPRKGPASCCFGDGCRGAGGAGIGCQSIGERGDEPCCGRWRMFIVGNLLHDWIVGKGVVGVTAIGHAMVPASADVAALAEAAIITGSRPPGDRVAHSWGRPPAETGLPATGGTGIETARASKEHEGAGGSPRRPRSGHGVGRRSPEGWSGHRVRGRRTARTRRGQAVGCNIGALRRRWSSLWRRGASSGSGSGQVVEAGAGGLSVKWLPGASCPARQTTTSRGDPHTEGSPGRGSGSSGWRAPRPCTGVPRSSGGARGVGSLRAGAGSRSPDPRARGG